MTVPTQYKQIHFKAMLPRKPNMLVTGLYFMKNLICAYYCSQVLNFFIRFQNNLNIAMYDIQQTADKWVLNAGIKATSCPTVKVSQTYFS
jgi:hypothetical protein